jgi:molybdopterin molybdotransferase
MMDGCYSESKGILSISEALELIYASIKPIKNAEVVTLPNALGRVLSKSVYSPIDIPFDTNSAMDGYAFCSSDVKPESDFSLELIGTSWAGKPFLDEIHPGQCIRIFTGASLPPGADSVIMQEHADRDGERIYFPKNTPRYHNVRLAGEEFRVGGLLCTRNKKLTPYDLGLLASSGINEVTVKRKIRIAFLSTGDELISINQPLESGKIYNSNQYLFAELLKDPCHSISDLGIVADDKVLLTESLINAAKNHDVIITTGGASVGEADYINEVLATCGNINFWKLAIKPGKPLTFGNINACHFFGLPGNPVSAIVTFQQIVIHALRQLSGASSLKPLRLQAICTSSIKKTPGRLEFQRGILSQDENSQLFVSPATHQGSHMLSSMAKSNCYIILSAESSGIKEGDKALVEPFSVFL